MSREIKINDKTKLQIGEFTTDRGAKYISLRRLYKGQDDNFYPQKTRSGGYNMIFLSSEEWAAVLPAMRAFLFLEETDKTKEDIQF